MSRVAHDCPGIISDQGWVTREGDLSGSYSLSLMTHSIAWCSDFTKLNKYKFSVVLRLVSPETDGNSWIDTVFNFNPKAKHVKSNPGLAKGKASSISGDTGSAVAALCRPLEVKPALVFFRQQQWLTTPCSIALVPVDDDATCKTEIKEHI